jgi:hypothetical protein
VDFEQLETDGLTLRFDKGLTIDNVELASRHSRAASTSPGPR